MNCLYCKKNTENVFYPYSAMNRYAVCNKCLRAKRVEAQKLIKKEMGMDVKVSYV